MAAPRRSKKQSAASKVYGMEGVKVDTFANKLTVIGKEDAAKVREGLAEKINKKVEIVSPQPKNKKDGGGDKKPAEKQENKADDKIEKNQQRPRSSKRNEFNG